MARCLSAGVRHTACSFRPTVAACEEVWRTLLDPSARLAVLAHVFDGDTEALDRVPQHLVAAGWWSSMDPWTALLQPNAVTTAPSTASVPAANLLPYMTTDQVVRAAGGTTPEAWLLRVFWPGISCLHAADVVTVLTVLDAVARDRPLLEADVAHPCVAPSDGLAMRLARAAGGAVPFDVRRRPRVRGTCGFRKWHLPVLHVLGRPMPTLKLPLTEALDDPGLALLCSLVLSCLLDPTLPQHMPCCSGRMHLTVPNTTGVHDLIAQACRQQCVTATLPDRTPQTTKYVIDKMHPEVQSMFTLALAQQSGAASSQQQGHRSSSRRKQQTQQGPPPKLSRGLAPVLCREQWLRPDTHPRLA